MDVMMSISPPHTDLIFQDKKPYVFRNTFPTEKIDTIYVYETPVFGGAGKVIGKFTAGELKEVNSHAIVEGYFIVDYCRLVLKDEELAQAFEKACATQLTHYKPFSSIRFALNKEAMKFIKENDEWPPFSRFGGMDYRTERILIGVENWIRDMGFDMQKYIIPILKPMEYMFPLDVSAFCDLDGKQLTKPPRFLRYVKGRGNKLCH